MILSIDLDNKNKEIFKYLHDSNIIPDYDKIDQDFGYSNKYTYKFSNINNKTFLKKYHILALEACYNIPRDLFFNKNIKEIKDIKEYIEKFKRDVFLEEKFLEALEEFKKIKYLYSLSEDKTEIKKRKIIIDGKKIIICKLPNNEKNFEGYIEILNSSILLITENPVTGNSIILKLIRKSLLLDIMPVSYLGHDLYRQKIGYSICSKKKLSDEEIRYYLNVETKNFTKIEEKIIENIKSF